MVPAPDQSGVPAGAQRFVLSLRAVGEGHLSSIEFRTGTVDGRRGRCRSIRRAVRRRPVSGAHRSTSARHSCAKLDELGVGNPVAALATAALGEHFTREELDAGLDRLDGERTCPRRCDSRRPASMQLAGRIELRGGVPRDRAAGGAGAVPREPGRERRDGGRPLRAAASRTTGPPAYHATYTAYDRFNILPQLISTRGLHRLPRRHAERPGGGEQGDGAVPAPRERPLRRPVAVRPPEHRRDGVRRPPPLVGAHAPARPPSNPGSCSRWATAARPWRPRRGGWS